MESTWVFHGSVTGGILRLGYLVFDCTTDRDESYSRGRYYMGWKDKGIVLKGSTRSRFCAFVLGLQMHLW